MDDKLSLDLPGAKQWTRFEEGHGSKVLRSLGHCLFTPDASQTYGELGLWGKWEAPSHVRRRVFPVAARIEWADRRPLWAMRSLL